MKKPYLVVRTIMLLTAAPLAATKAQAVTSTSASQVDANAPTRKLDYLRIGLGTNYDAGGYYRCGRLTIEYAPTLAKHLGLASRLVGTFGKPTSQLERQAPEQNYKAAYVEQEVVFYPFGTHKKVLFGIGAGGFAGYYKKNTFSSLSATAGQLTHYELASYEGVHAGYLFSASVDVALGITQRWRAGIRSSVQNGIGGNSTTPSYNLTLARRL